MAKDVRFLISANPEQAVAAMQEMQKKGEDVSNYLSGAFRLLGAKSDDVFLKQKLTAQAAFDVIKQSGTASTDELRRAQAALNQNLQRLSNEARGVSNEVRGIGDSFNDLKTIAATIGLGMVARDIGQARMEMDRMQNALAAGTGSQSQGAAEFAFARSESDRLGLSLRETAEGYGQLVASSRGTALEGEKTRQIFSAVATASTVLGRSTEETSGMITALGQMISKGTIQSEELKGQLGERLPGAMQIAAQAMGVTTSQLQKMLDNGQLMAEDFLPRFAAAIQERFANQVPTAVRSSTAEFGRLKTAVFDLMANGTSGDTLAAMFRASSTAVEIFGKNTDIASAALLAMTGSATISGLGKLATTIRNIGTASALAQAGVAGLAAGIGYAIGKAIDAGSYKLFDVDISGMNRPTEEMARAQKTLESNTTRLNSRLKELGYSSWEEFSKAEASGKAVFDSLSDTWNIAARAAETNAGQVKKASESLTAYAGQVQKIGDVELKAAASGFSDDLKRQADYLRENGILVANLSRPLQEYLSVIDSVYGKQLDAQKAIGQALFSMGADQKTVLQQNLVIAQTEQAVANSRLQAWQGYYNSLAAMHTSTMASIQKAEQDLFNIRMTTGDLTAQVQQKLMSPMEQYYAQVQRLDQKQQMAMSLGTDQKIQLLQQVQQSWASMTNEVKSGDQVVVSAADAATTALDKIKAIGRELETEKASQINSQADTAAALEAAMRAASLSVEEMQQKVMALNSNIAVLSQAITLTATDQATPVVESVKSALASLQDKTITITAVYRNVYSDNYAVDGSYAVGTSYVPRTGLYQLHRGEEVRTRTEVSRDNASHPLQVSFGDVHLDLPNVTDRSTARDLAREALPEIMNLMKTRFRTA